MKGENRNISFISLDVFRGKAEIALVYPLTDCLLSFPYLPYLLLLQREKKKRNSIFPSSKIWEKTFSSYGQGTGGGSERASLASVGDRLDPRPTEILIRLAIANIGLPKKQTKFMVAWPFEKQENIFV